MINVGSGSSWDNEDCENDDEKERFLQGFNVSLKLRNNDMRAGDRLQFLRNWFFGVLEFINFF